MPTFEVTVVMRLEETHIVTVEADDASAAEEQVTLALVDQDVTEFETVRKVGITEWVGDEIDGAVQV